MVEAGSEVELRMALIGSGASIMCNRMARGCACAAVNHSSKTRL
jgi:hypothetical protein